MSIEWDNDPEEIFEDEVRQYLGDVREAVFKLSQFYEPVSEAWMKEGAVWTDRSGDARQTLFSEAVRDDTMIELIMGHGMEYGENLELDHGGRFAIVNPALDRFAPILMNDIMRLLE